MTSLSVTYIATLAIAATVNAFLTVVALRRIQTPGSTGLAMVSASASIWCAAYSFEWWIPTLEGKVTADEFVTLGAAFTPTCLIIFAIQVTERSRWLSHPLAVLLVLPVITHVILAWTNPLHHLYHTTVELTASGGLSVLTFSTGPAYSLFAEDYAYLAVFVAIGLLVHAYWGARDVYRVQFGLILAAVGMTVAASLITETGLSPWPQLDLAPMSLTLAGPLMAYALLRRGLLDLVPVARGVLVESMEDAIVVVDNRERVVDLNPAAQRLFGLINVTTIGISARVLLGDFAKNVIATDVEHQIRVEIQTPMAGWVDLRIIPLSNRQGRETGRLIVIHDIQSLKHAQIALLEANENLSRQLIEIEALQSKLREQAIRDFLTGLVNRRFCDEWLPRELNRCVLSGEPLAVVMLDIDHFKRINDTYGHQVGDTALVGVGRLLEGQIRLSDLVCRHGGEEFLIVLPNNSLGAAFARAEEWRNLVAKTNFGHGTQSINVTISLGIAVYPEHANTPDGLVAAADQALYLAKARGRNRTVVWARPS